MGGTPAAEEPPRQPYDSEGAHARGGVDEESRAEGGLVRGPPAAMGAPRDHRQDVIHQHIVAAAHRVLDQWACVRLALILLELHLHANNKHAEVCQQPPMYKRAHEPHGECGPSKRTALYKRPVLC